MGITNTWDNEEKTIIHQAYEGVWSWAEFDAAQQESGVMLDSVDHKVGLIIDIEKSTIPEAKTALAKFSDIAAVPALTHPNAGLAVVAGASRLAATLIEAFGKFHKPAAERMAVVPTLEEAYEIIAEHRGMK